MTIEVTLPKMLPGALTGTAPKRIPELELSVIQRLASGRAALPMLPAVASRSLELASDPDASTGAFAALIETDPPIAARFLATANSALYFRGHEIRTVGEAVGRIGLSGARDLVLQVVYATSMGKLKLYQKRVQASFERSVRVAVLCQFADAVLQTQIEDAYLCGLLHDIGESRICRILNDFPAAESAEVERLVERYHPRAGAELAKKWSLSDEIVEVCRRHEEDKAPETQHLRLVRLANALVPLLDEPPEASVEWPEAELELLEVEKSDAQLVLDRGRRKLGG